MRYIRVYSLFLMVTIFFLLFNSHIPITDPVEGNYALTAKEMLISGDWLSPRIYGQFWYDKPIMIYWLIIISFKIFGINEFAARFPSAFMSALSVTFLYWFTNKLYDKRKTALLSTFFLATSLEFWILAKMIITDATLFFFTSVSMATLYLALLDQGRKWYVIAYAAAGLAVLTKGPVGIVLPGITILIYIAVTRRWNLLRKLFIMPGLFVFLVVSTPWYLYMYKIHGADFINTFLGLHNYIRATVSEHPEYNVFYYYLVLFPLSLLPWTGVFLRAIISAVKEKSSAHSQFLLIWPAVTIAFYTAMATKYPTYVFPATFPVAILMGKYMEDVLANNRRKLWLWLTIPVCILVVIVGTGVKIVFPTEHWRIFYGVIAILFLSIIWYQVRGNGNQILKTVAISTTVVILLLNSQVFPLYADTRSAKTLVEKLPPSQGAIVGAYGDYMTSGIFYSGYLMPKLVKSSDELVPQGSWAGKYTMPTEVVEAFNQQTQDKLETYILVDGKRLAEFQSLSIARQFNQIAAHEKTILYKRVLTQ